MHLDSYSVIVVSLYDLVIIMNGRDIYMIITIKRKMCYLWYYYFTTSDIMHEIVFATLVAMNDPLRPVVLPAEMDSHSELATYQEF